MNTIRQVLQPQAAPSRLPCFWLWQPAIKTDRRTGHRPFFLRKQHHSKAPTPPAALSSPQTQLVRSRSSHGGDGFVMPDTPAADLLHQAYLLAAGYDYDAAIELLKGSEEFASDPEVISAIAGYESTKATLVRTPISQITHVFFHTDCGSIKAFDRGRRPGRLQPGHDHHRRIQQNSGDHV